MNVHTLASRAALCVLAFAFAFAAPRAHAVLQTIEQAYETTSVDVSLPDSVGRSVGLPGCAKTCPPSVQLTKETRYYVAKREVRLAELRAHLARGRVDLTIFYDPKTLAVTRIRSN